MKNRTLLVLFTLTLLLAACAPAAQPTAAPSPAPSGARAPLNLQPLGAASAKLVTQIFPAPGESNNLPPAWVYGWDGLIMMEDAFYYDASGSLNWTSTLPDALDYACRWDGVADPTCQTVSSVPQKAGGAYSLLTVGGEGQPYLGVVDGRKFSLYSGTASGGQIILAADLPEGAKVRAFRYFPQMNVAALHVQAGPLAKETLLVLGDSAGSPYEISFCRPFNASNDPSKTISDLACMLSRGGEYQLGRGDVPEIIATVDGKQVSPLPAEILTGFPDMNSLMAWPDGRTISYANQTANAKGEIDGLELLKFDLEKHSLTGRVKIALPADELNQFRTDYAVSPDGSLLAIASLGNKIELIDTATGQVIKTLEYNSPASRLAFSPDGKKLAAGFFNRQIVLFGAPMK